MKALRISDLLCLRKRKVEDDRTALNYKTVGLIGLCSGAGTTQLGIMLANYFSNGLHLKTAVVSTGTDDAFDRIKEEKLAKNMEREYEIRAFRAPMEENPFEMKGSAIQMLKQVVT